MKTPTGNDRLDQNEQTKVIRTDGLAAREDLPFGGLYRCISRDRFLTKTETRAMPSWVVLTNDPTGFPESHASRVANPRRGS